MNILMLLVGDFNYILQFDDKKGGKQFQVDHLIRKSQSFLHLSRLIDLGYKGPHYTWYNNSLVLLGFGSEMIMLLPLETS